MRAIYMLMFSTALAAAGAARAQAADDDIVVTAAGFAQPRGEVGQAITVVDSDVIETRQSATVVDLLATTPGITFNRTGGFGSATTLRVRGAEGEHTLVLVDGVKINDPASPKGAFDFGNLLTGNIDRIEVLRGPNSVIWGSQAIGGVIDIRTEEPSDRPTFRGRAEYGYRDQGQVTGNLSGKAGPVAASIGGGYFRTDGISQAANGTERDGYENVSANAKARITVADGLEVDLRGYYSDGKVDTDGYAVATGLFGDTRERSTARELLGYAGLNATLLDGRFRSRFAYSHADIDRENRNADGMFAVPFESEGQVTRIEYRGMLDLFSPLTLVFGGEREISHLDSVSRSSWSGVTVTRGRARIDSLYAQAVVRPFAGLAVSGGLRRVDHDSFGGDTSVGANISYSPNGGRTVFRGTYAEGFNTPTLYQLQSEYGNAALEPERAKSWDVGVEQRFLDGRAVIGATWFDRRTRNLIDFVSCFSNPDPRCATRPFGGFYDNLKRGHAEGAEVTVALQPVDPLRVQAQYTFIEARNLATNTPLLRRPRNTVSVSADYSLPQGLGVGATILHVDGSYDADPVAFGTVYNEGYVLVSLRASYALTDRVELYGRVENLFDADYVTTAGYGTYGRSAFAGVRVKLD